MIILENKNDKIKLGKYDCKNHSHNKSSYSYLQNHKIHLCMFVILSSKSFFSCWLFLCLSNLI